MVSAWDREQRAVQTYEKKIPAEAVDLYTRFIHGEITRRAFGDGVKKFAVAGLTTTAIIER